MSDSGTLEQIPLDQIKPSKLNPRKSVGDVAELAQSIKTVGLLEPLIVVRSNGSFELVAGARRHAALKLAGETTAPVIVRDFDGQTHRVAMLIENLQREDLSAFEEAGAYEQLLKLGLSQRELAEQIGRSQGHVSKRLALLKLPAALRKQVDSGGIAIGDAVELARLVEHPARLDNAVRRVNGWGWSVRQAVDGELEAIRCEEKVAAAKAKAEAEGLKVVGVGHEHTLPRGVRLVAKSHYSSQVVIMDPDKHAKEPCHAIALTPDSARRLPVCTNPKAHPGAKPLNERTDDARRKRRREHEKQLQAVAKERRRFMGTVGPMLAKNEATALLVEGLIDGAHEAALKIACEALELKLKPASHGHGRYRSSFAVTLSDAAAKGDAAAIGVAIALAQHEESLSSSWWASWKQHASYFDLLKAHGYEASAAEKLELAGKAPKP